MQKCRGIENRRIEGAKESESGNWGGGGETGNVCIDMHGIIKCKMLPCN